MYSRATAFVALIVYLTGVALAYVGAILMGTGKEVSRYGIALVPRETQESNRTVQVSDE